jgi:hypothetical protein
MGCRVSPIRTIHFPVFIFPFRINHLDQCAEEIEDRDLELFLSKGMIASSIDYPVILMIYLNRNKI